MQTQCQAAAISQTKPTDLAVAGLSGVTKVEAEGGGDSISD